MNSCTVVLTGCLEGVLFVMAYATVSCDAGDDDCEVCDDVPELSDSDEEQWQSMEEGSECITVLCLLCDSR